MSDSDSDDGSDDSGFDKEAEREKLRKKFERDEEKRESTRRMSELLLKGATMTNRHCDACGAPIFRQNGQEFCPNCDADGGADGAATPAGTDEGDATTRTDAANAHAGAAVDDGPQSPDAAGTGAPSEVREVTDADTHTDGHAPDATGAGSAEADPARRSTADADVDPQSPAAHDRGDRRSPPSQSPGTDPTGGGSPGTARADRPADATPNDGADAPSRAPRTGGSDGEAAARDALVAAVTRHANAAGTDDARAAREHLAAAREAAEALAALDRVGR